MIAQLDKEYTKTSKRNTWVRVFSYLFFEGRPLTTKGRWINPLVFFLFKIWKTLPRLKKVKKPVFVVGTGRSGTTVLGVILSMHRQVSFLNEPKALWHAAYPYEDIIGSYSMGKANYRLMASQATGAVARKLHRMFGAYLLFTGRSRVVDKYPELVFRRLFVDEVFPDAIYLFLVRNGWDTIQSIDQWSDRLGKQVEEETHDWWGRNDRKWKLMVEELVASHPALGPHKEAIGAFDNHVYRAAVEWILTMEEGLAQLNKHPENFHLVKYEDLVHNKDASLQKLLQVCALKPDPKFTNYALQKLRATTPRNPVELPAFLQGPFQDVMSRLGY